MAAPRKSAARTASPAASKAAEAVAPVAEAPPQTLHPVVTADAVPASVKSGPLPAPTEVLETALEQVGAVREALRQTGETTLENGRVAYDRLKKAAEETSGAMEAAYGVAQKGLAEINAKAMEAFKVNSDASFEFARALSGAKSLSDVLALQGEHARKGFEALTAQTKEIASLAQKVAADAAGPISSKLTKGFNAAA